MEEVFINEEARPYILEADGTLDLGALRLQPSSIAISGRLGLVDLLTSKTKRTFAKEASSQAVSLQQVDQTIQQQVDHRIQDALKAAKHHTHSSPSLSVLSTVSQEFKYKNIAQEARHEQYLLHDPQMHNEYLSPKRNDGCLEDLEDVNKQASEIDVLIPKLRNTFAQCLDASVSVLGGCPTFEVGFKNVVNSHQVETTGRLKPDIVVVDSSFRPSALSMLTFVKVLTGAIDDDTHAGKMAVYLNKLLQLNPGRTHVYGALTHLEHAVVYLGVHDGKIRYSQPVRMEKGGMTMMVNLLLASCSKLGYTTPELNLQGYYAPVRVLGLGRNSAVYEAAPTQEGQTAQRYAVKVFGLYKDGALSAFDYERKVLGVLKQSPAESPNEFTEGNVQGYLDGLRCLHNSGYVHCDIEPRHSCRSGAGRPAIIDLGEARALEFSSDSPKRAWTYRGLHQKPVHFAKQHSAAHDCIRTAIQALQAIETGQGWSAYTT
ncbi:hypothetical protein WJX82_003728 [Trebouxia sp. C0006]